MDVDETARADRAHRSTYNMFTGIMKWAAIVSALTAIIVILIIRN